MSVRKFKAIILALLIFVSCFFVGFTVLNKFTTCMDIKVASADIVQGLTEVYDIDIANTLMLDGKRIPYDRYENTIYLSQPKSSLNSCYNLAGNITSKNSGYSLYFIDNKALRHLNSALKQSFPLTMVVVDGKNFMYVDVILTTLPIMTLYNSNDYNSTSKGDSVEGELNLWCGYNKNYNGYTVDSVRTTWRVRGNTASVQAKKPYKLSLKDNLGNNTDKNFLGLGSDDDWILNSLTMDDTRMKEKLFMDMWNEMASQTDYNYKMSSGEYVELIINNSYRGLYLLQRRVDAKYLGLDDNDALLKATDYTAETVETAYEFVTEPQNTEEIYEILTNSLYGWGDNQYNVHNVIDTNLTLQITAARDNFSKKNMFHVLKYTNGEYENFLVPWDTDQSMGVIFRDGFKYDFTSAVFDMPTATRMETEMIRLMNPDYDTLALKRWTELRNGVYSDENIEKMIDEISVSIIESGALERDTYIWGERYGGEDTIDNLRELMKARARVIDFQYLGITNVE